MESDMLLQPGDIFLTQGTSWLSRAIRVFTRGAGESRTEVNHVGIVVRGGSVDTAEVVEALSTVRRRKLWKYHGGKTKVMIVRPCLEASDRTAAAWEAGQYVGRKYGYTKIVAHFLDWCLGGMHVFRRIARMDKYPICSWVVAYAYVKVGWTFNVPAWTCDPDHIYDHVVENPSFYEVIHPLEII